MHKLESFLRIDETLSAADLLRARAVYFAGAVVVLTQMFNLIFMTIIYGEWTLDHSISSLACLLIITATSLLRYSKNFAIFAAFYALLILTSVTVSALPDHMGINSSMFPLLMGGVILCGMISSWRSVAVYSVGAIGLVWMLYFDSMIHPVPNGVNPNDYATLSINKAVQTTLAFIIVSLTMGLFAICLDRIFTLLETNIQLAKQAERTKSSFLANMSHELRTPLNGVIGMAGLLSKTELSSQQRQYTDIINGCSTGLVTIINDVLDLSKLDSGKTIIQSNPFKLRDMIAALALLHSPAAIARGVALTFHYADGTPNHFMGDESRLRQVVNNLVGNALKFTPQGGRIDVTVKGRPLAQDMFELFIFVKDTGLGIAQSDQARVFDRFEQVDSRPKSTSGGTGLGLAISRELSEAMGGTITLQSEEGNGTMFTMSVQLFLDRRSDDARREATGRDDTSLDDKRTAGLMGEQLEPSLLQLAHLSQDIDPPQYDLRKLG